MKNTVNQINADFNRELPPSEVLEARTREDYVRTNGKNAHEVMTFLERQAMEVSFANRGIEVVLSDETAEAPAVTAKIEANRERPVKLSEEVPRYSPVLTVSLSATREGVTTTKSEVLGYMEVSSLPIDLEVADHIYVPDEKEGLKKITAEDMAKRKNDDRYSLFAQALSMARSQIMHRRAEDKEDLSMLPTAEELASEKLPIK